MLRNLGLSCSDEESNDDDIENIENCEEEGQLISICQDVTPQELTTLVQDSQLNWFEVAERLENTHGHQCPHIKQSL